jgi:hypothetical protein
MRALTATAAGASTQEADSLAGLSAQRWATRATPRCSPGRPRRCLAASGQPD